jgi:hypothetical protein
MYCGESSSKTVFRQADEEHNVVTLMDIDEWLEKVNYSPLSIYQSDNLRKQELLEKSYKFLINEISNCNKPPVELYLKLANVLRLQGQMPQKESECSKQILLAALNIYLYAIDSVDLLIDQHTVSNCASLSDFTKFVEANLQNKNNVFLQFEKRFDSSNLEVIKNKIKDADFKNPQDQEFFANTVCMLITAYLNTLQSEDLDEQNKHRLIRLLSLATLLLGLPPPSDEKKDELFELNLTIMPRIYQLFNDKEMYDNNCKMLLDLAGNDPHKMSKIFRKYAAQSTDTTIQSSYYIKYSECQERIEKDNNKRSMDAVVLSENTVRLLEKEKWDLNEVNSAKEYISIAKRIVNNLRKKGIDREEFKQVDQTYKAVYKRLNQPLLRPDCDREKSSSLYQETLRILTLAEKSAYEIGDLNAASLYYSEGIKLLEELIPLIRISDQPIFTNMKEHFTGLNAAITSNLKHTPREKERENSK